MQIPLETWKPLQLLIPILVIVSNFSSTQLVTEKTNQIESNFQPQGGSNSKAGWRHIGKYSLSEMPAEELIWGPIRVLNKAPIKMTPTNVRPAGLEADNDIIVLTEI